MTTYTATYSPDDNKLRLYASTRLDAETYARVKAAGFKWAPKQELFVAPMWTPDREDLLLEFVEEIGDEDSSLVDRAEQRAERFEDYSEKRAQDSERAHAAVAAIADNIPLGQPILIGHHSEKHARRDQKRIENGMRKAVNMWETAKYWEQRAQACLGHAEYKQEPRVRASRIKTIEADKRKMERTIKEVQTKRALWETCENETQARMIAAQGHYVVVRDGTGYWTAYDVLQPDGERYQACPAMTWERVREILRTGNADAIPRAERWIAHYDLRISYEKALLAEQGASDLLAPPPKTLKQTLPLLNYRAPDGFNVPSQWHRGERETFRQVEMTKAEYMKIHDEQRGTRLSDDRTHKFRIAILGSISKHERVAVFLTDSKVHPVPQADNPMRSAAE